MSTYKFNQLEVVNGNKKLGKDTLIFNLGSASECPSKKLGLCLIPDEKCYALKAEKMYPGCLPYRQRQSEYWLSNTAEQIFHDFKGLLIKYKALKKRVKYLRFNESGDFHNQSCVYKLSVIAGKLFNEFNITTYGYTARKDLSFNSVNFLAKGSSHIQGNNGICIARKLAKKEYPKGKARAYHENGIKYVSCIGSCFACKLCKVDSKINIVIALH